MLKIDIMDNRQCGYLGSKSHISVGGNKKVYLIAFQRPLHAMLKKQIPQYRMPRWREENNSVDIFSKNKTRVILPVKEKIKLMLRMGADNPLHGFGRKPTYTIHLARQQ
jgi:hypothetical protein